MRKRIRTMADIFSPEKCHVSQTGCWLWKGRVDHCGYGYFTRDKKQVRVARLVVEAFTGPLGKLEACHTCDVPKCIRPNHLFRGTHADNMHDMALKNRQIRHLGASGIRGIIWRKGRCKWSVMRYENGKQVSYGDFDLLEEAKKVKEQLAQESR